MTIDMPGLLIAKFVTINHILFCILQRSNLQSRLDFCDRNLITHLFMDSVVNRDKTRLTAWF